MTTPAIAPGEHIEVTTRALAHGGEAIGDAPDGRVVFVRGALPGETVTATLTKVKKRWARADLVEVIKPSPHRVDPTCPAAAAGAGCCDLSFIDPAYQLELKTQVLRGQLQALAGRSSVLRGLDLDAALATRALAPASGWRTRVRLGVDAAGRAGVRKLRSNDVVADALCSQAVPGLLDGLVGPGARSFTPGAEVIAVRDATSTRHVVEIRRVQRGRRAETVDKRVEGSGIVEEHIDSRTLHFPATAFWQAHVNAPQAYTDVVAEWGSGQYSRPVAWDLYGGVGMFAPALSRATGGGRVETVDYSPAATSSPQPGLADLDLHVTNARVEEAIAQLPAPGLVVLDPPRAGAGAEVVRAVAAAGPERVIHVGCDPATLARDLASWGEAGFAVERLLLIDAFPNTHHFETMCLLRPADQ